MSKKGRVFSGARPTGRQHLGNYLGAIQNYVALQDEYECVYCIVDIHALTTVEDTLNLKQNTYEMALDWLAAGIRPEESIVFVQSHVPQVMELHTLLSMVTPLGKLTDLPTFKEKIRQQPDNINYGLVGYPVLMTADIVLYKTDVVPVGIDQAPHIEFAREIARRFNHLYGREPGYEEKAQAAIKKLGGKKGKLYEELRTRYQQAGDQEALAAARALLAETQNLSLGDMERLYGYLEGGGKMILTEPDALLTPSSKMPGLDGQKMSKSYNNTIALREDPEVIHKKIRTMPTDPARIRRSDPGNPERCPVWQLHQVYSDEAQKAWVREGCTTAGIGCLECKQPIIDAVLKELAPIQERARALAEDPDSVRNIIADGCEKARDLARETMRDVREAMGLVQL